MACVLVIYKQLFNHLFIQQLFAECLLCAGLCARPWGLRPADISGFLEAPSLAEEQLQEDHHSQGWRGPPS